MHKQEAILEINKRADEIRKTATSEHYIYLHAINDFMSEQRKTIHPDKADQLQGFLLRKFGIE